LQVLLVAGATGGEQGRQECAGMDHACHQLFPWPSVILRITSSMPKLAAFIRGGNWAKLYSHFET
jgi:hypothetical protein